MHPNGDHATPTARRAVTSYAARHLYHPGPLFPPAVPNVRDFIDLHAHCHGGQQDALALAKLASESGMLGILYKTIVMRGARGPAAGVAMLREQLAPWAEGAGVRPIECWAGLVIGADGNEDSLEYLRAQLDAGVRAVWLPANSHANSYFKVGIRERQIDPSKHGHTAPLPWDEALKYGLYMLDERGKLKDYYAEIVRIVADYGVALFFGHATHREIEIVAELVERLRFRRAIVDHPFSPFVDVSVEMMRDLAKIGVRFNFTYDELSPLLGIDPYEMHAAIAAVGAEHCTLSSDCGEPLFPNSVEAMRQISGFMQAFGSTAADITMMCTTNPADIVSRSAGAAVG